MFKALIGEKEVDVDVLGIMDGIDDVFHINLTSKTGITVDHDKIVRFVVSIINENNIKEKELTRLMKESEQFFKEKEEELNNKKSKL